MNPLQYHFDMLHSLILKAMLDNHLDEKIVTTIKQEIPNLIVSYNKVCKVLGYEVNHQTRREVLFPQEDEIDHGIEDTDHA